MPLQDHYARLKRPRHPMPDGVRDALIRRGVMDAYLDRPAYQQNDYIGWIQRAKRETTRGKRIAQMLEELENGDAYMRMAYRAKVASPRGNRRRKDGAAD